MKKLSELMADVIVFALRLLKRILPAILALAADLMTIAFWSLLNALPVYYWWNFGLANGLNLPTINILTTIALVMTIDVLFKGNSFRDYISKTKKE